ncbi:MAG: Crp/Fnr family transcriptional regulator, partial [Nitrospiraceae bacterium]|nr:Crp/Fnr family transcriptional regulator [Nitrospiraceae bacterium]
SYAEGRKKPNGQGRKKENGLLKDIELFSSLSEPELKEIKEHLLMRDFKRNHVILQEEETSEFMYIIIHGKVKISRIAKDGKETILSMHGSGDFFGELSLIDGKTTPATVLALDDAHVAIISKDHFYSLLYTQRKVLEKLLQILCARLRESWNKIQMLTFHNASDRVKLLLRMLADHLGEDTEKGTILTVKLIHQDIADMTGLTRETVTRVLDRYVKSGEIKILDNRHILLTPEFDTINI